MSPLERYENRMNHSAPNRFERASPAVVESCFLCGSNSFTWGAAVHDNMRLRFQAAGGEEELELLKGLISVLTGPAPKEIRARKCEGCGNLQLFVTNPSSR